MRRSKRRNKKKKPKSVGHILNPTSTHSVDLEIDSDIVKENDFLYCFDSDKNKVIIRATNFEASINKKEDTYEFFADGEVIGYVDNGSLQLKRFPLDPETKVYRFKPKDLAKFLHMDKGMFIGFFPDTEIPIRLSFEKMANGHTLVLGRTGFGKSWTLGVILEEIHKMGYPAVVIDPHGEYHTLNQGFAGKEAKKILKEQGLKPQSFPVRVIPCISDSLDQQELKRDTLYLLVIESGEEYYTKLRRLTYDSCRKGYTYERRPRRELPYWVEVLHKKYPDRKIVIGRQSVKTRKSAVALPVDIRTHDGYIEIGHSAQDLDDFTEIVDPTQITVIDMRRLAPEHSKALCADLSSGLFLERKRGNVPPFIYVIEEAHTFARSGGKEISNDALETLAKEARKYGMPCIYVSQRPNWLSTTVRANCGNWIVMRTSHPSDQSAITGSCEGLDTRAISMLKNLPRGVAMITGELVDFPLLTVVRHRQSEHSYSSGFKDQLSVWRVEK